MSSDSDPVIHTVGSLDRPDPTEYSDEMTGSVDNVPPRAQDSKSDSTNDRNEVVHGDTVKGPVTQHDSVSSHTSSEPGVIGEIRTVGSAR